MRRMNCNARIGPLSCVGEYGHPSYWSPLAPNGRDYAAGIPTTHVTRIGWTFVTWNDTAALLLTALHAEMARTILGADLTGGEQRGSLAQAKNGSGW